MMASPCGGACRGQPVTTREATTSLDGSLCTEGVVQCVWHVCAGHVICFTSVFKFPQRKCISTTCTYSASSGSQAPRHAVPTQATPPPPRGRLTPAVWSRVRRATSCRSLILLPLGTPPCVVQGRPEMSSLVLPNRAPLSPPGPPVPARPPRRGLRGGLAALQRDSAGGAPGVRATSGSSGKPGGRPLPWDRSPTGGRAVSLSLWGRSQGSSFPGPASWVCQPHRLPRARLLPHPLPWGPPREPPGSVAVGGAELLAGAVTGTFRRVPSGVPSVGWGRD